jgi:hypothetical protein
MREYVAAKPIPVMIGDREYFLLFSFGKIKRIREQLKVDLLSSADVNLDVFTKVLFAGLVHPGELTEEKLDDLISIPQLTYYIERLQLAITGQIQPSKSTKNDLSASSPETGSASEKVATKPNSDSGVPQLVNGASETPSSGA